MSRAQPRPSLARASRCSAASMPSPRWAAAWRRKSASLRNSRKRLRTSHSIRIGPLPAAGGAPADGSCSGAGAPVWAAACGPATLIRKAAKAAAAKKRMGSGGKPTPRRLAQSFWRKYEFHVCGGGHLCRYLGRYTLSVRMRDRLSWRIGVGALISVLHCRRLGRPPKGVWIGIVTALLTLAAGGPALAQNATWSGPGDDWSDGANWIGGAPPSGVATFNGANPTTIFSSADVFVQTMRFTGSTAYLRYLQLFRYDRDRSGRRQ